MHHIIIFHSPLLHTEVSHIFSCYMISPPLLYNVLLTKFSILVIITSGLMLYSKIITVFSQVLTSAHIWWTECRIFRRMLKMAKSNY